MSKDGPTGKDKFIVRLPSGLRDRIRSAADIRGVSMNTEIIETLELKYPVPISEVSDPAAKTLLWMAGRIRRRNPKPGSFRDKQAQTYERLAKDILAGLGDNTERDFIVEMDLENFSIADDVKSSSPNQS